MISLKKYFLILIFYGDVILGTIFVNTQFDMAKLSYCYEKKLNYINVTSALLVHCIVLIAIYFIIKCISDKASDYFIAFLSGLIIGSMASIRSYSGEIQEAFLYTVIVSIIVTLYAALIKIMISGKGSSVTNAFTKLHNSIAGKPIVITILLINIFIELKILKFF